MTQHQQNGTNPANLEGFNALMQMETQFDDVLPEPIEVTLVDYMEQEVEEGGVKRTRRRPILRKALINTYVPMKVLHKMMASQDKLRQMQSLQKEAKGGAGLSQGNQQMMMEWMTSQVLAVWQLTEPDMTADKLSEGLSFQKVFGLFRVFFGDLLSSMNQAK